MRSGTSTSSTSRHPGRSHRAQNVRKLMLLSENTGMLSATTRPPTSRARADGDSWCQARASSSAPTDSTFQFRGRSALALIPAKSSISSSLNSPRHPWTMASSVVPGCWPVTSHSAKTSSCVANRLGTGSPSPSLCVLDRLVEKPRPPASNERCSSALMASSSAGVDARPVDSGPITYRRSAQWPTRNPAFTAMRPSSASRY